MSDDEGTSTPQEKALGALIRNQCNTDFYVLDKFPEGAQPFCSKEDPTNPNLASAYAFFMRGQEILSAHPEEGHRPCWPGHQEVRRCLPAGRCSSTRWWRDRTRPRGGVVSQPAQRPPCVVLSEDTKEVAALEARRRLTVPILPVWL